jgi:hypothetical protein
MQTVKKKEICKITCALSSWKISCQLKTSEKICAKQNIPLSHVVSGLEKCTCKGKFVPVLN